MCVFTSSGMRAQPHPGICSPLKHAIADMVVLPDGEGPDKTARMHRLIRVFAASMCPRHVFARFTHTVADDDRSLNVRKRTFANSRPVKIQIDLRIWAVIRSFTVSILNSQRCIISSRGNNDSYQTARTRKLISFLVRRTFQKVRFFTMRFITYEVKLYTHKTHGTTNL